MHFDAKIFPSPSGVTSTFQIIKFLAFFHLAWQKTGLEDENWKHTALVGGSQLSVIFSRILGLKWIFCINVKKVTNMGYHASQQLFIQW